MGAGDINNLTQKFTEALIEVKGIEEIHLMLGSINPNLSSIDSLIAKNKHVKILKHFDISAEQLAELLKKSDLAICPASTISLESCAIGIGLISGFTADNQKGNLFGLVDNKAIIDLGDLNAIKTETIVSEIKKIAETPNLLNELIQNQKKLIDGKSPKRLLNIFKKMVTEKIHFRFARESDTDLYYKWSNDSVVRNNSYNQDEITYESHVKWFNSKLQSPVCFFYLFLNEENQPIGQVRIDNNGKETVIGISIDEHFRGKKLGSILIQMASEDYLKNHSSENLVAYIKQENSASYNSFTKAGFGKEEIVTEKGIKRLAIHVEDHPLEYAKFHGVIPEGNYGAGKVEIWDKGKYELKSVDSKKIEFALHGKKMKGNYVLVKTGYVKNGWLWMKI
jgi:RimJ/RimL family protein N-acetyltransferase